MSLKVNVQNFCLEQEFPSTSSSAAASRTSSSSSTTRATSKVGCVREVEISGKMNIMHFYARCATVLCTCTCIYGVA